MIKMSSRYHFNLDQSCGYRSWCHAISAFGRNFVAHIASISCANFPWPPWAGIYTCSGITARGGKIAASYCIIFSLFTVFSQCKWSFVDLFQFPLANMVKATYENIKKLCTGVFSRKQMLQFAPATTASCDVSIQLLFSGDSTLCAHTCETRLQLSELISFKSNFYKWTTNTLTCWAMQVTSMTFLSLGSWRTRHLSVYWTSQQISTEISENEITFPDTVVYKGDRFNNESIVDIKTHYKPTSIHTLHVVSPIRCHGFIKGEAMRLLRIDFS